MSNNEGFISGKSLDKETAPLSLYPGLEATIRGELGLQGDTNESYEAMVNPPLSFEQVVQILSKNVNARNAAKLIVQGKDQKDGFDFDFEMAFEYSAKLAWAIVESLEKRQ